MNKFFFIIASIFVSSLAGALSGSLLGLLLYANTSQHPHAPFPYWMLAAVVFTLVCFVGSLICSFVLVTIKRLEPKLVAIVTASLIVLSLAALLVLG